MSIKAIQHLIPIVVLGACAEDPTRPPTIVPQEPEQQEEATNTPAERAALERCYSVIDGQVVELDMIAEQKHVVASAVDFGSFDLSSLGYHDNRLIACERHGDDTFSIGVLDLATGKVDHLPIASCDAVTATSQAIWVQTLYDRTLYEFDSLAALYSGTPMRALAGPYASRLGRGDGRLLAAWHSSGEVLAVDATTGNTKAIPLDGYDGWIFGLAEGSGKRAVAAGWSERGIRIYDATSGKYDHTAFAQDWVQGLACTSVVDVILRR